MSNAEKMPQTAPKPFCFVLMPFDEAFNDVYRLGIKEACSTAGAYCERVDEQIFTERILDRIYNQIAKADIVIADMTARNPNVFYEVGYAHALGKLTVLLTQQADDIPFDLKHFPHIVYGKSISYLRGELEKRVAHFIAHPPTRPLDTILGLRIFLNNQAIDNSDSVCEVLYDYRYDTSPKINVLVHNESLEVFNPGDFKVAIITSATFIYTSRELIKTISLPKDKYLHEFQDPAILYPGAYASFVTRLGNTHETPFLPGMSEEAILKLSTKAGSYDYQFTIKCIGRNE